MIARPGLPWRIFAVATAIAVLPFEFGGLFRQPSAYDAARYAVDTVATIGLVGYAFSRPMGPRLFWTVFAALFALYACALMSALVTHAVVVIGIRPSFAVPMLAILLFACLTTGSIAIGLLRHGGWRCGPGATTVDYRAVFD